MPGILDLTQPRRAFLRHTALAAVALAFRPRTVLGAEAPASAASAPVRLALLSDTHTPADRENQYRGFFPVRNLETAVPQVLASQPDAVIVCGDAARLSGELDDYRALQSLLTPVAQKVPVYIGLGNHDNRENFFKVFAAPPGDRPKGLGKHVMVLERPGIRFVVLDSLLYVNQVAGLLGKAQRDWLRRFLGEADRRTTVLFVHHTLGDADGELLDVDRLFALLKPHPHVRAIFYGHSHVWGLEQRDDRHLVNLPAVGYNFRDQDPVGWVDATFTAESVELTLRAFAGNRESDGRKVTLTWAGVSPHH